MEPEKTNRFMRLMDATQLSSWDGTILVIPFKSRTFIVQQAGSSPVHTVNQYSVFMHGSVYSEACML